MKPIGHKDDNGKEICVGHTIHCSLAVGDMNSEEDYTIIQGQITVREDNIDDVLSMINNTDTVEIVEDVKLAESLKKEIH